MRANGAQVAVDHQTTLVAVLELSGSSWMIAGQIPGVERTVKSKIEPSAPAVLKVLEGWVRRARAAGKTVSRTVLAYEIGRDGFWLARLLAAEGIEVQIIQPASVAVDRRARRAKKIGRASCRESVDLGGRRIIKKKKNKQTITIYQDSINI